MTVQSVMVDGKDAIFRHSDDLLSVDLESAPAIGDRTTIVITYSGEPADGLIISTNRHGDRTFFGDNWPDRARHWLPVVDHPSDKALVEFVVTAPDRYQVVGTGRLVEVVDLPGNRRRTHWASTKPVATKVAVIGAAQFAVEYVDVFEGVSIESWVYPQDKEAGFFDYALAEPVLRFFVSRLGEFPYAKLANVQSKTRYGGMENASNIFYSESSVTGSRSSEQLIAHEIAHQWFGDSVTESDWPHIWLSEGFATYLAALYVEHTYGADRFQALMARNRETVVNYAKRSRLPVIVDPAPDDLIDLLTPNSYQKGGWVLHMLRYRIGTEVFWDGLREFYSRYRDANASTGDFLDVMEDVSGQDLDPFFDQWLEKPGHPVLDGSWTFDATSRTLRIDVSQTQPIPFSVPIEFGISTASAPSATVVSAYIDEGRETFEFQLDVDSVEDVQIDPGTRLLVEYSFVPHQQAR